MKSKLGIVLLIALVLLIAGAALYMGSKSGGDVAADGSKRAPTFQLPRANGEILDLAKWKDEIVIVHFWAAWCPPCIPEIPEILDAAKKLPKDKTGRAIHWVLVSQDPNWEKAHSIVKEETLPENVSLVLDSEAKVSDLFGSYQFPETYLINRDGGLSAKWIGAQAWSGAWGDQALVAIEKLSREKALPAPAQ